MLFQNLEFFFHGIPGELNDLHPVQQGRVNGLQEIGTADEHDLAQVDGDFQEIIHEVKVLGRVKHLQQCVLDIASKSLRYFIDLIE